MIATQGREKLRPFVKWAVKTVLRADKKQIPLRVEIIRKSPLQHDQLFQEVDRRLLLWAQQDSEFQLQVPRQEQLAADLQPQLGPEGQECHGRCFLLDLLTAWLAR